MFLTYRYRIKDTTMGRHLDTHARAVNYVWNYCCEAQRHAMKWHKKWPSWIDLVNATSGVSVDLKIHSDTVSEICRKFAKSRDKFRRCPGWRSSKKSLGWIPFVPRSVRCDGDSFIYLRRRYRVWLSRTHEGRYVSGSFSQDARGRWFANIQCDVERITGTGRGEVGVDLGLKTLATLSNGETISNPRYFAKHEAALAMAHRAGNIRRAKAIQAKISNCRRDHLHKESTRLANTYQKIVVGNVSASKLKKTNMAKSVSDAGWHAFKEMLRYKMAIRHGAEYAEASEYLTTQTCSGCGCIAGPKGRAGLNERVWTCGHCGSTHDRDVNAAKNILGAERRPPVEAIAA